MLLELRGQSGLDHKKAPLLVTIMTIIVIILLFTIANSATWAASHPYSEVKTELGDQTLLTEVMASDLQPEVIAADFQVDQDIQGQFLSPGILGDYSITIFNQSDTDTELIEIDVDSNWQTILFQADGFTLLEDSNHNGRVETVPIAPGASIDITAQITAPVSATIGDQNHSRLELYSSLDPSLSRLVVLQAAIPAPFSQAFRHETTAEAGLYFAQKDQQHHHVISSHLNAGSEIAGEVRYSSSCIKQ